MPKSTPPELQLALSNIDRIYDRDLAVKRGHTEFIRQQFESDDPYKSPFTGMAAHMMYNGTCLSGPGGMYGLTNDYDYAPGEEPYLYRDLAHAVCKRLVKLRSPIIHKFWHAAQVNYYSSIQIMDPPNTLGKGKAALARDLADEILHIIERSGGGQWLFVGMYTEHRVRRPNVCFPKEPQTREDYSKTLYHFVRESWDIATARNEKERLQHA